MKAKASLIAQKLLNLYRQEHVIFGGWAAVNAVFVNEATPEVITELQELPTGKMLAKHIENLRSGKTPMDSIERDLLPYGGMMSETVATIPLTPEEWTELENGINNFTPDENGLNEIQLVSCNTCCNISKTRTVGKMVYHSKNIPCILFMESSKRYD